MMASANVEPQAPSATVAPMRRRLEVWALSVFLAGFCTYRAVTQSITYDEACTYIEFVRGSWWTTVTQYTANNHVLFTLLAKLSTDTLGVTELTLRLPTLLGAALYATSAFVLCRRLTDDRIVAALASAAMTLNPFVLDFLVAARGYGLALGFLLMALVMLARALDRI
jgi:mannosyltransferase